MFHMKHKMKIMKKMKKMFHMKHKMKQNKMKKMFHMKHKKMKIMKNNQPTINKKTLITLIAMIRIATEQQAVMMTSLIMMIKRSMAKNDLQ